MKGASRWLDASVRAGKVAAHNATTPERFLRFMDVIPCGEVGPSGYDAGGRPDAVERNKFADHPAGRPMHPGVGFHRSSRWPPTPGTGLSEGQPRSGARSACAPPIGG